MFSVDWFTQNIPGIEGSLAKCSAVANNTPVNVLEIGVYEGQSTLHWLNRLHNDSKITVLDPFIVAPFVTVPPAGDSLESTFRENIKKYKHRVKIRKGFSQDQLYRLKPNTFDVIYVDGSHTSWDALTDIVMSFHLLKVGGLMMIDDYGGGQEDPEKLLENSPGPAVNAFCYIFERLIQIVLVDYQLHFIKLANTCDASLQESSPKDSIPVPGAFTHD